MRAPRISAVIAALLMVFGLFAATSVLAGPAGALDYPGKSTLTVNDPTPKCGQTVDVVGTGFLPDTLVTVTVGGKVVGTITTDDQGSFTFPYVVPDPCVDGEQQTITATDGTNTLTVDITLSATTATTLAPSGNLPRTGSSDTTLHLVQLSVLLIAVGGVLLVATRKRRHTADA